MAAPISEKNVELGFLEECDAFLLKSRFFPSKFGGRPAWLSLNNLPGPEELLCRVCSKPTMFLLQVGAPLEREDTFHRTIFLFVCTNPKCCKLNESENILVFRSQLERKNDFYGFDPPPERPLPATEREIDASLYNRLCRVCGSLGPKTCSKCHQVHYCSKEHQTIDWKKYHKQECNAGIKDGLSMEKEYSILFPEQDIVSEEEPKVPEKCGSEKSDDEKMKEYKELLDLKKCSSDLTENLSECDLQEMAGKETENIKQLHRFKERINLEPEQVMRYHRGGEPLWIAYSPKPDCIPSCDCGAARQFEFQVLPQLLSHMKVDSVEASLDWGTVCIYTCSNSCATGNKYKKEYVFKQDLT